MLIEELASELNGVFCETGIASVAVGKQEILLVSSWMDGIGKVAAFQVTSAITPARYTVLAAPKEVLILGEHPFDFSPFPAFLTARKLAGRTS
jgi:hypothetical protein